MDARRKPTILIVDDEPVSRMVLAELVRKDCRVLLARDGEMALDQVAQTPGIDLVLLDISMPGMSGYEVLARLRSNERTLGIPVICITGQTTEEAEERALRAGAADFVQKPIRAASARARIENQLKLAAQHRELEELSERDALTGIANRRQFDKMYENAIRHAARTGEPFALALMDIDHFKQYNDYYGHAAGDEALRNVAQALAGQVQRPYDVLARFGGEEFALLLPAASEIGRPLERMRKAVADLEMAHEAVHPGGIVTISCGGVVVTCPVTAELATRFIEQADQKLYAAKREGRNRVHTGRV